MSNENAPHLYRCTAIRKKHYGDKKHWGRSYWIVAATPQEAQNMVHQEEPDALCVTRAVRYRNITGGELLSYTRAEVEEANRIRDQHDDTSIDE
jgi:hypothetical protein